MTSSALTTSSPAAIDRRRRASLGELAFTTTLWLTGGLAALSCGIVALVLVVGAWPALSEVGFSGFLFAADWQPLSERYGLASMMASTLAVSAGALAVAGPLAVLSALYAVYFAGPLVARIFSGCLLLLASIPSVVYGLWGIVVLIPKIAAIAPPGASVLAGVAVLSLMILPTIAVVVHNGLVQLPPNLYQGAIALGMTRPTALRRVVVPAVRRRVIAGGVLGLARALGETMAVLMVTGNAIAWPTSPFASVRVLSSNVVLEMAYAMSTHRSALFVSALVLMGIVFALVMLSNRLERTGGTDEA